VDEFSIVGVDDNGSPDAAANVADNDDKVAVAADGDSAGGDADKKDTEEGEEA
jgi:hypothetical protein